MSQVTEDYQLFHSLAHARETRDLVDNNPQNDPPSSASTSSDLRPVTQRRQIYIVVSGFLTVCITIGFNQSYGVFQNYYTSQSQDMLPASSQSQTALIAFVGTLGAGLTWAGSIAVNPLMARVKSLKYLTVTGVLLMSAGFALASLSTQIWHLLLTQGLLFGIGSSLLYFPILSITPEYFSAHRGIAMGIVLSGSGIGGLILSPLTRTLLSSLGSRWTLRCFSFLNLVVSLPIALTAAPSRFTNRRNTHVDLKLALKPAFIFSVGAAFLQAAGNLLPLTFLVDYSLTLGYSASFGVILLAVSNGVNSIFRILAGYAGDQFGRQNTIIFTGFFSAVTVLAFWLSSTTGDGSQALWVLFVIFYGATGSGYNALLPTTIVEVFGLQAYASVNGFIYFVRGLGAMLGSPIGGQLLGDKMLEDFRKVVWLDFALLSGVAVCVIGVRGWDAANKKEWKWKA